MPTGYCVEHEMTIYETRDESCDDWEYWNPWHPPPEDSQYPLKRCHNCKHRRNE